MLVLNAADALAGLDKILHDNGSSVDENVVSWSEFDRGGRFAAMEVPDILIGDVREFPGSISM